MNKSPLGIDIGMISGIIGAVAMVILLDNSGYVRLIPLNASREETIITLFTAGLMIAFARLTGGRMIRFLRKGNRWPLIGIGYGLINLFFALSVGAALFVLLGNGLDLGRPPDLISTFFVVFVIAGSMAFIPSIIIGLCFAFVCQRSLDYLEFKIKE